MPDYTKLKTELTTDPAGLGYSKLQSGLENHNELAQMLNATTGAGSGTVTIAQCSDAWFASGLANASMRISALTDADKQAKWRDVLQYLHLVKPPVKLGVAPASAMLADAVTDGMLTQAEVDAITKRTGSRAEVIGYFDTITETPQTLDHTDIAKALRS